MQRQGILGLAFLSPALVFVILFFLAPVVMTGFFAFTTMSTATGITGGSYRLTQGVLNDVSDAGSVPEQIVQALRAERFVVDTDGLAAMVDAGRFDNRFIDDIRDDLAGRVYPSQGALEDAMEDLDNRPRRVRDIKIAAALFERSSLNVSYETAAAFRTAMLASVSDIPGPALDALTDEAFTGWRMTTDNFRRLVGSPDIGLIFGNTVFYVFTTLTLFNVGFALVLAITTFYLPAGQAGFFRALWLLPRISPPVLYVLLWKWLAWDTGFLNAVLEPFGVQPRNWMLDTTANAWTFVILINGFIGASMGMIIFSSAIRAIPQSILHAAQVDGANRWQQVRHIILPQLRWPLLFITAYQTLSLLTSFQEILLATNGGPGSTTKVWALAAYNAALSNYAGNLQYGYGAAMALVLVVVGILLSVVYLRLFNFDTLVSRPRIER